MKMRFPRGGIFAGMRGRALVSVRVCTYRRTLECPRRGESCCGGERVVWCILTTVLPRLRAGGDLAPTPARYDKPSRFATLDLMPQRRHTLRTYLKIHREHAALSHEHAWRMLWYLCVFIDA